MTVMWGTVELEMALINWEPFLMIPAFSKSLPTMNPVMFWRNSSGVSWRLQSWMKCAAFSDSSGYMTPLLPRMPTG